MSLVASDLRQATNDVVKAAAEHALRRPADEKPERLRILGVLLDPHLGAVERAIARYESRNPFSTTERERIAAYVTRAIDRKVLGADGSTDILDLSALAGGNPVAWVDSFARACVIHGVTEVRRDRGRSIWSGTTSDEWLPAVHSAEDMFLQDQRADVIDMVADVVDTWGDRTMTKHERDVEVADALRALRGVPQLHLRDAADRRWIAGLMQSPEGEGKILESLHVFRDLASGSADWGSSDVDDRLLDLWIDFTADQADALVAGGDRVVLAIVRGAVVFPPQPQDAQRVAVRRIAKGMSAAPGWSSLVMELERTWVGEYFGPRRLRDNMDRRSHAQAEAERQELAAGWPYVAARALDFSGRPLGPAVRTVDDVASWLHDVLQLAVRD